jgi:hypothetical protein
MGSLSGVDVKVRKQQYKFKVGQQNKNLHAHGLGANGIQANLPVIVLRADACK